MLFELPPMTDRELGVIEEVEGLRKHLRLQLFEPRRWLGSLRRLSFARAIQGSNSIEGYSAALDDVAATAVGEEPLDAEMETRLALRGYRESMTYVLQLAGELDFEYSEQLLKSLQFMMTSYDLSARPGLWRSGAIYVHDQGTGRIVYEGPGVDILPELMRELVEGLNRPDPAPVLVRAGMAHLNLVMVHPFRDGNGRMARCLQTLILAREGVLAPQFCSIEEYLGRNAEAYYAVLAGVGGGRWQPERDVRAWVRFIVTAHFRQAQTLLRRVRESEQLWTELEGLVAERALPERVIPALFDAALGLRIRNATYRALDEGVSEQTAGRDLRLMADRGLLAPRGEKRGRYYVAADELAAVWVAIRSGRDARPTSDPFEDD